MEYLTWLICAYALVAKNRNNERLNKQSGIALGPILYIIAALAILAAAIAAGSGSFNVSTSTESAKAMAETVINSCGAYQDALNLMLANGCDPTALDFTPTGGGWPSGTTYNTGDYTGSNGTNQAGNGQCALFDPRGGGMIFKSLPPTALMATPTGAYSALGSTISLNYDAFAGYPFFESHACLNGVGTCATNATLLLEYPYLNYAVCKQINNILNISIDPNSALNISGFLYNSIFSGTKLQSTGDSISGGYIISSSTKYLAGCGRDNQSNSGSSAYLYACALVIR